MTTWEEKCDEHFGWQDPSGLGKIAKKHGKIHEYHDPDDERLFSAMKDAFEHGMNTARLLYKD